MLDTTPLPTELLTYLTKERTDLISNSVNITRQVNQVLAEDPDTSPYYTDLAERLRTDSESISWLTQLITDFSILTNRGAFMAYGNLHRVPNTHRDRARMQNLLYIVFGSN